MRLVNGEFPRACKDSIRRGSGRIADEFGWYDGRFLLFCFWQALQQESIA